MKKIAIVGTPNSGKSSVFSRITKKYSAAANYPYTTVDTERAVVEIEGETYEFIDTPGINSLEISSEHEISARNILFKEKPSVIIQCADASNIKRSLLLTAQLIELNIPLIICLNFMDEAQTKGIWINSAELENQLRVPVVETIGNRGLGVKKLLKTIPRAHISNKRVLYQKNIEKCLNSLGEFFPYPRPDAALLLILLKKTEALDWLERIYDKEILNSALDKINSMPLKDLRAAFEKILEARNLWVEGIYQKIAHRSKLIPIPLSEKVGHLCRHPVFGWLILGAVIYAVYFFVAEIAAVRAAAWLNIEVFSPLNASIDGIIPWQFLREFLTGPYGLLTTGVFTALGTVFPILTMYFIILAFLEDIGYIPNLCVLLDRFLKKIGLTGRASLPLALGFGCKTMAVLTTKMLDSPKEKYISIFLLASYVPCSAQFSIHLATLAYFPLSATLIVFAVLASGGILTGFILNKLIKQDTQSDFILEIPSIKFPNVKNLFLKVYYLTKSFFQEAFPLFLAGAILIFAIEKIGVLSIIRKILAPVVESFLSLPIKTLEVFMFAIVRREQAASFLMDLSKQGEITSINLIVCIIIITGFVPCINTIGSMVKQLSLKSTLFMLPVLAVLSILVGGLTNWILRAF